jgi:hypothetical protein
MDTGSLKNIFSIIGLFSWERKEDFNPGNMSMTLVIAGCSDSHLVFTLPITC